MRTLFTYLERLQLTVKLVIGFSIGLLVALVMGINALSTIKTLEHEIQSMYENDLLGISHLKEANYHFLNLGRTVRHALLIEDEAARNAALAQVRRSREKLTSELSEARKRIIRPEGIASFEAYQKTLPKVFDAFEHMDAVIRKEGRFSPTAIKFMTSPELGAIFAASNTGMNEMIELKEKASRETLDRVRELNRQASQLTWTLIIAGGGLTFLLGALVSLSIRRPNDRLRESVEALAGGDVNKAIPNTDYPNEIGVMARAIAVLQGIYRKAEDTRWIKSHAAEIASALQQATDSKSLAQTAVSRIATVIGAGHGAVYVADGEQRFNLLGSYGYRERKQLNNSFAFGEGLVGQAAMEKAAITLTAPKDYIRINSGLGEGPPACISVLPIIHGDRVLAVLEVASFQQFTERDQALLDALLPVLATSMEIMDRNQRTRELLAATQEQAERMEKQAAQLEEQQVEMEAQQAELLETENWFRSIIESAADGMLVADAAGRILLVNPMAEEIFGYAAGELVGASIEQLVPDSVRGNHAAQRAAFIAEGRSRTMGATSQLNGKCKDGHEVRVHVTLSPLPPRGNRGKCVSISVRKIEA